MTAVREAMNPVSVTVGSGHTMREAARRMIAGRTGAAVVLDPELPAPGIVTERDLLRCVGEGCDLDTETVGAHLTAHVVYADADWPLERAAEQMTNGGFRHVLVMGSGELVGILSMRDIVGSWVRSGATAQLAAIA
jgi:CBS domain-containing protein